MITHYHFEESVPITDVYALKGHNLLKKNGLTLTSVRNHPLTEYNFAIVDQASNCLLFYPVGDADTGMCHYTGDPGFIISILSEYFDLAIIPNNAELFGYDSDHTID